MADIEVLDVNANIMVAGFDDDGADAITSGLDEF
jgi:hypothetical protein